MILACPSCDSRYDVSGHASGQQFRCRCGTLLTLEAPSTQAAKLACPQCGAGVAPNEPRCGHCQTELLLKACPRCLSRVFHGHAYCPQCGGELGVAAVGADKELPCPRCETSLRARLVDDVVIDECASCLGLFLDKIAIQRVIADRQQARAEALLGTLPRREVTALPQGRPMYVKCPTCRNVMNRKLFATGSGVVVDVCRTHGTFFDAGELPAIIDFVMQGGLEKAERRDLERLREQARRERDDARYAQIQAARMTSMPNERYRTGGAALVDLLFNLFN